MRLFEVEDKIEDLIKRDCGPYLKENTTGLPLTRGLKTASVLTYTKTSVNKNRRSVDVDRQVHFKMNKAFEKYGFVAKRDNSIFCTGDREIAKYYGTVFYVFPIGDFSYTWSPEVEDLVLHETGIFVNSHIKYYGDWKAAIRKSTTIRDIEERFDLYSLGEWQDIPLNTNDERLKMLLRNMDDNPNIDYRIELDQAVFDEFVEEKYRQDGMTEAIKSGKEIMITCDSYYAVTEDYAKDINLLPKLKK